MEEPIDKALYAGFYSLIYLTKAIGNVDFNHQIQISVVTDNVLDVIGNEILCPEKATIQGLVKVIPQEYSDIICRIIDIVVPTDKITAEKKLIGRLFEEFGTESLDNVIAYRNNYRWVQTYEQTHLGEITQNIPKLRKNGVYLITGGMGNIGFLLADYLVKNLQAKLILIGRAPIPARDEWEMWLNTHDKNDRISLKIYKLLEFERLGGEILAFGADIANLEQIIDIISFSEKRFGQINGVIHAAGDTGSSIVTSIEKLSEQECSQQFHPKINGLVVLQAVLENKNMDFFYLTSSLSPILGGLGFAAYAAANAFMDAFSVKMNRTSTAHWISVNWADWNFNQNTIQETMDVNPQLKLMMTPEEGLKTFQKILYHCDTGQIVVSSWDLQHRLDKWVKLKYLRNEEEFQKKYSTKFKPRPNLLTPYEAPVSLIEKYLAELWEDFFNIKKIGITDDFFELGGDSLKGIVINAKISKKLKVKVPLVDFFNNLTIKQLTTYINKSEREEFFSIEPAEKKEYYLSSFTQRRFYILQYLNTENISYNLPMFFLVKTKPDKNKLEETFTRLIMRHEGLRTSFELIEGEIIQKIAAKTAFTIEVFESKKKEIEQISRDFIRPFNLGKVPLLRVGIIITGETEYILMIDIHHIITDGISSIILSEEFVAMYEGKELPPLPLQYKDFSEWQNSEKENERINKQKNFWLNRLTSEHRLPKLNLRTDYPRPPLQSFEGSEIIFVIGVEDTNGLNQLVQQEGISLYMALLAVYTILLWKLTGQSDIIIGTGVLNRNHADLMNIIGLFFNTIPLRIQIMEDKSIREFLKDVKEKSLDAFENQDYPINTLVEDLVSRGVLALDSGRNPLFDTMFALQNYWGGIESVTPSKSKVLTIEPYRFEKKISRFDLFLEGTQSQDTIYMKLEFSTTLFKQSTAEKISRYYMELIKQVLADKETKLKDFTISTNLFRVESTADHDEYMDFGF